MKKMNCFYILIIPKFDMNANITKMQVFNNMTFDLIITFTYVLMDNFCPCFIMERILRKKLFDLGILAKSLTAHSSINLFYTNFYKG